MKRILLIENNEEDVQVAIASIQESLAHFCKNGTLWTEGVTGEPDLWRVGCEERAIAEIRCCREIQRGFFWITRGEKWDEVIVDLEMLGIEPLKMLKLIEKYCSDVKTTTNAPRSDRANNARQAFPVLSKEDLSARLLEVQLQQEKAARDQSRRYSSEFAEIGRELAKTSYNCDQNKEAIAQLSNKVETAIAAIDGQLKGIKDQLKSMSDRAAARTEQIKGFWAFMAALLTIVPAVVTLAVNQLQQPQLKKEIKQQVQEERSQ